MKMRNKPSAPPSRHEASSDAPNTPRRRSAKGAELPIEKQAYKSIASIVPEVSDKLTPVAEQKFTEEFQRNFKHQFEENLEASIDPKFKHVFFRA